MSSDDPRFWDGDLYKLLVSRIDDCSTPRGQFSIGTFAKKMGATAEGLYKYLRSDRLTLDGAKKIIKASDGRITELDLVKYLFR